MYSKLRYRFVFDGSGAVLLLRLLLLWLLFIVYCFLQMATTFLIQATYMRLEFDKFTVPAASLSLFDTAAVLMLIPIMDHVVYPLVSYCGISFTPLRRIGVGMLLACASVIVAGVVEIERRSTWIDGGFCIQNVFGESRNASSVNVFWQIPQFVIIGASEVLMVITGKQILSMLQSQHSNPRPSHRPPPSD